jgi:hypothetical protein
MSTILIERTLKKPILPESGTEYNTASDYVERIGGAFKEGTTQHLGRHIFKDRDEERRMMSVIIGVSPGHLEFEKMVNDYWEDFTVLVPFDGKTLDISGTTNQKGEFIPNNYFDYVLYLYCLKYDHVCTDPEIIGMGVDSSTYRFYLKDEAKEIKRIRSNSKYKDEATIEKLKAMKDQQKAANILYVFGENIVPEDEDSLYILLNRYAEADPKRFVEVCKNADLEVEAFINRCLNYGLLTRPVNSSSIIYDGSKIIGYNMNEAIGYLKDSKNANIKTGLEAGLANKTK